MKVVFLKNNEFLKYCISTLDGYVFNPRNKGIDYLNIVNNDLIEIILSKKIKRDINKVKKTIKLIISCDVTIESDCDMMIKEVIKLTKKLENNYMKYFNEFEYFYNVKELYMLNNLLEYKKKIVNNKNS